MARIKLDKATVRELAFDVACQFFKPPQLCRRYHLSERQLESILKQDQFKREVDEVRWLLQDDGKRLYVKARAHADDALDYYHTIMLDESAPASARSRAADKILSLAGIVEKGGRHAENGAGNGGGGLQLILNTNLSLPGADGAYQLRADAVPVRGQVIEGRAEREEPDQNRRLAALPAGVSDLL